MRCSGLPSAPLPAPRGAAGPGDGGQARCKGEELGAEPAGAAVQCSTALRIPPVRTVSVLSLRQLGCRLRGSAGTKHPRHPADPIRSASTRRGLRCSSSKAAEDTVRPLLSLSLARELEGAAGSSEMQPHAVQPSPHPCTPLQPSLRLHNPLHPPTTPCTHAQPPAPTNTPVHPRQLAAPPMPAAEQAVRGRCRRAPVPAAVQRTRPSRLLAPQQRGDTIRLVAPCLPRQRSGHRQGLLLPAWPRAVAAGNPGKQEAV